MTGAPWLPLLLAASITAILYDSWTLHEHRRRLRGLTGTTALSHPREPPVLLSLARRLLSWYQRDTLPIRLAQAGHPRFIGQTPAHFYAAKLLFALILGIRFGTGGILPFLTYAAVGFFLPDFLLRMAIRRRHEQILEQLPQMLDFMAVALSSGSGGIPAALAALPHRLSGPLREEVVRLSAEYALTMDLPRALAAFAQRIGMEEIDHFCLALRQAEVTGRVRRLLTSQSEALKLRLEADRRRQLATRANFLPIVSVLMVLNIMLIIGLPLMFELTSNLTHLR